MSLIELERVLYSVLNDGRVRRKANRTGDLRLQASRVARGSPEVMVKITGFGKSVGHMHAHLRYITRNANVELETDRGDILRDKDAIADLLACWTEDLAHSSRQDKQRHTMHLVLSMPEGTPETAVRHAARRYAKSVFSANHEYAFALHTDEPHPHVHLTVKMMGFNGKKMNPRKADLHAWREAFAREMRDQGVDAEATPRSARGVVRKAEHSVVRHIERGDDRRPPRVPRVKAARINAVVEELIAEADGRLVAERPWDARIKQRQQIVRDAWLATATALDTTIPCKEYSNAPPEYDKLDAARVRAGQRAAALYQSSLERTGIRAPAVAIARVRNMSRLDVVQYERPAQVLLHTHAPDGVGRHGGADYDLRWPRTRALTIATGVGGDRVEGRLSKATERTLAATIRHFVRAMPPIDTERHELKARLACEYSHGHDLGQSRESGIPTFAHRDPKRSRDSR